MDNIVAGAERSETEIPVGDDQRSINATPNFVFASVGMASLPRSYYAIIEFIINKNLNLP